MTIVSVVTVVISAGTFLLQLSHAVQFEILSALDTTHTTHYSETVLTLLTTDINKFSKVSEACHIVSRSNSVG